MVMVWSVVLFLFVLPLVLAFIPELMSGNSYTVLYTLSLAAATFVMMVRPLADIFGWRWLRSLVILRKGFGILSASIIIGFLLGKIVMHGDVYFAQMLTTEYWSLYKFKLFAHLGDISGVILLATSNKFSRRSLGKWWKRVQKLAYVYFYSGALYEILALQSFFAIVAMLSVSLVVMLAAIVNMLKIRNKIF